MKEMVVRLKKYRENDARADTGFKQNKTIPARTSI